MEQILSSQKATLIQIFPSQAPLPAAVPRQRARQSRLNHDMEEKGLLPGLSLVVALLPAAHHPRWCLGNGLGSGQRVIYIGSMLHLRPGAHDMEEAAEA